MQSLDLDTSGFYKFYSQERSLIYAPNFVHSPYGELSRDDTSQSIDGQKFYNSEYDAYIANGMDTTNLPIEITRMQFKVALLRNGDLENVEAIIATQSAEVQLIYKELLHIRKDSPMLKQIAYALEYNDTDIDNLFNIAKTIEP